MVPAALDARLARLLRTRVNGGGPAGPAGWGGGGGGVWVKLVLVLVDFGVDDPIFLLAWDHDGLVWAQSGWVSS